MVLGWQRTCFYKWAYTCIGCVRCLAHASDSQLQDLISQVMLPGHSRAMWEWNAISSTHTPELASDSEHRLWDTTRNENNMLPAILLTDCSDQKVVAVFLEILCQRVINTMNAVKIQNRMWGLRLLSNMEMHGLISAQERLIRYR